MILGDNIFYGNGIQSMLANASNKKGKATIFSYHVEDPCRFGVVEFNSAGQVLSVEEKPKAPKSNYAITGLYFYDNRVVEYAKALKPSARGELEITDLNRVYLEQGDLEVQLMGRGYAWLDTGTMDSLLEASEFVEILQKRQGIKISVPEEIAYSRNWINSEQLREAAKRYGKSPYGQYLDRLAGSTQL